MANRYLKATGNYSAVATWSETDGGAAGASAPTSADNVYITANGNGLTLTLDAASAAALVLCSGASTATLAGTQTWTVGGNVTLLATMTVPNTITWTITGTGNFAGSTLATLGAINLNGTAHTLSGALTNTVLTRNGTATKTDTLTLTSGTTVTCTTCALIGNSAINRLLVQSSTLGTAATITATNWTGTLNADFMDITSTNAVDFSAVGLNIVTGDCGGNTGITFTASAAQTYSAGGTDVWSEVGRWTSRIPLPQDDVTCGASVTINMPRIGRSITFTGTPTVSLSQGTSNYGSLTLVSGMTYTHNNKENIFCGRGSFTITLAGNTIYQVRAWNPSGTLTYQDAYSITSIMESRVGILDTNDQSGSAGVLYSTASGSVLLRSGTITLNIVTASASKVLVQSGGTITAGTSTIILTNSTANAQTFAGGGLTYNNVTVQGTGNYALTISGNNVFNILTVDRSQAAKTITGTAGSVQTIKKLIIPPISSKTVVTLNSTGAAWTITGESRHFQGAYLSITNVVAGFKNTYYAGTNSTDGGGNINWIFRDYPGSLILLLTTEEL